MRRVMQHKCAVSVICIVSRDIAHAERVLLYFQQYHFNSPSLFPCECCCGDAQDWVTFGNLGINGRIRQLQLEVCCVFLGEAQDAPCKPAFSRVFLFLSQLSA
jgi:hypothetical protein